MKQPGLNRFSRRMAGAIATFTILGLSAGVSFAQTPSGQSEPANHEQGGPAKSPLSAKDKEFAQKVAKGGALQIELSKVELQQGQNPQVKKYALQTVENMSKAGGMLHAIASNFGLSLPEQPPPDVQKLAQALAADHGKLVDSEYIAQLVPASTVAVNLFKDEENNGKNPKLVHFAKQMMPKLQKHQKMALQISENMGKSTAQQHPGGSATTGAGQKPGAPAQTPPSPASNSGSK